MSDRGAPGAWDYGALRSGGRVRRRGFHLWYSGGYHGSSGLAHATSMDGCDWIKDAGNPLPSTSATGSWDDRVVLPSPVISGSGPYRMWYVAASSAGSRGSGTPSPRRPRLDQATPPRCSPRAGLGSRHSRPVGHRSTGRPTTCGTEATALPTCGVDTSAMPPRATASTGTVPGQPSARSSGRRTGVASASSSWVDVPSCGTPTGHRNRLLPPRHLHLLLDGVRLVHPGRRPCRRRRGLVLPDRPRPQQRRHRRRQYELWWLPRGADNIDPEVRDLLARRRQSVRYANVLAEVFGLEPDAVGALAITSSSPHLLAMSRTYNLPATEAPAPTASRFRPSLRSSSGIGERADPLRHRGRGDAHQRRLPERDQRVVPVDLELFDMEGNALATETMVLRPWGNDQINRVFEDFAPVTGYVEVSTPVRGASSTATARCSTTSRRLDHDPADVTKQRRTGLGRGRASSVGRGMTGGEDRPIPGSWRRPRSGLARAGGRLRV